MNLINTGGSINPLECSLIYSNKGTIDSEFGNKIKLNSYKSYTVSGNNVIIQNADESEDIFEYDSSTQKYINKEEVKIAEDLNTYCNQIDELSKEIEKCQEEVLSLKNKRICENCYAEIELSSKYCPHCGFEQAEEKKEDIKEENKEEATTVEIVEEYKKEE